MEDFTPSTLKVGDVCTVINLEIGYIIPFKIKWINIKEGYDEIKVVTEDDLIFYFNQNAIEGGGKNHFHQGAMYRFVCRGNDKSLLDKLAKQHIKEIMDSISVPYNQHDHYFNYKKINKKIKQLP